MTVIFQCSLCECMRARKRKFKVIFHEWLIAIWLLKITDEPMGGETAKIGKRAHRHTRDVSWFFFFSFAPRTSTWYYFTDVHRRMKIYLCRPSCDPIQSCASPRFFFLSLFSSFLHSFVSLVIFSCAKSTARKLIYCSWYVQWTLYVHASKIESIPGHQPWITAKRFGVIFENKRWLWFLCVRIELLRRCVNCVSRRQNVHWVSITLPSRCLFASGVSI